MKVGLKSGLLSLGSASYCGALPKLVPAPNLHDIFRIIFVVCRMIGLSHALKKGFSCIDYGGKEERKDILVNVP